VSTPPASSSDSAPAFVASKAALLCAVSMLNHIALSGGRVAAALSALHLGMSPLMVGVLLATFAFVPMLMSISTGRLIDRIGVQRPLVVGNTMVASGALLACLWPSPITLMITAATVGVGFMLHQMATQRQLGQGTSDERLRNFSWMSLAHAVSGLIGPLSAGLSIDYLGYRYAFGPITLAPLIALFATRYLLGLLLPAAPVANEGTPIRRRTRDMLSIPALRRVLLANLLISGAWDTHQFLMPLYGKSIGLSATTIGVVLASFAAATFTIRFVLPYIQRRVRPWSLVRAAMAGAAISFTLYPWFDTVEPLMAISFLLGLALGCTQPSILALLHQYAPDNRVAEAFGMRLALINASQVSLPLGCGALAALTGLAPLFWVYTLALAAGIWFNRHTETEVRKFS